MPYSWTLPGSSTLPTSTPIPASGRSTATVGAGALTDQEIDPLSLDFIDAPGGEWAETADSRSIMLCQLELELGRSYSTPADGTSIKEMIRRGDPVTPEAVIADIRRAAAVLEADGVITFQGVTATDDDGSRLVDQNGTPLFLLSWIDLATGSPVDLVYLFRQQGA